MTRSMMTVAAILVLTGIASAQQQSLSPDGKLQAVGKGATVSIIDVATGKELRVIKAHNDSVNGVAFSPNGKVIASVGMDRKLCLMDLASGKLLAQASLNAAATSVMFSADGKTLTASQSGAAETFDAATLKKVM